MFQDNEFQRRVAEFTRLLQSMERVFLLSHLFTDADDYGACVGLCHILRSLGHKTEVVVRGGLPDYLREALEYERVLTNLPSDLNDNDMVIICGCSSLERTGFLVNTQAKVVNIDHHPDNVNFGDLNFVYPGASSASEIAFWIMDAAKNFYISDQAAESFLFGILSDTGIFRFSNTNSEALKAVSILLKKDAAMGSLLKSLCGARRVQVAVAWKEGIEKALFNDFLECVSVAIVSQKTESGSFDGLVDFLNRSKEAKFTVLSRQEGDVIKTSFRSSPTQGVDVGDLARAFGGGGHKYAAGFTMRGRMEIQSDYTISVKES